MFSDADPSLPAKKVCVPSLSLRSAEAPFQSSESEFPPPSNSTLPSDEQLLARVNPALPHNQREQVLDLLKEFHQSFVSRVNGLKSAKVPEFSIEVETDKPVTCTRRRISPQQREIEREKIEELLANDLIYPSKSPYSSPVVLVKKRNSDYRFCVDYRKLNQITKSDRYPLPRIDDTLDLLGGSSFYSTIDMRSGYHQIPVKKKDREKLAFLCSQGLFEWRVLPFGLKCAPAAFQRCVDAVMSGAKWFHVVVYIDDLCAFSKTFEAHLEHVRDILQRLRDAGLIVNLEKCFLFFPELRYLGFVV